MKLHTRGSVLREFGISAEQFAGDYEQKLAQEVATLRNQLVEERENTKAWYESALRLRTHFRQVNQPVPSDIDDRFTAGT